MAKLVVNRQAVMFISHYEMETKKELFKIRVNATPLVKVTSDLNIPIQLDADKDLTFDESRLSKESRESLRKIMAEIDEKVRLKALPFAADICDSLKDADTKMEG